MGYKVACVGKTFIIAFRVEKHDFIHIFRNGWILEKFCRVTGNAKGSDTLYVVHKA